MRSTKMGKLLRKHPKLMKYFNDNDLENIKNYIELQKFTCDQLVDLYYDIFDRIDFLFPVLEYILEKGCDVNAFHHSGLTLIHIASRKTHDINVIQFLIERGADLTILDKEHGDNVLHSAVFGKNLEYLKYFVEDCNLKYMIHHFTVKGFTPLSIAAKKRIH